MFFLLHGSLVELCDAHLCSADVEEDDDEEKEGWLGPAFLTVEGSNDKAKEESPPEPTPEPELKAKPKPKLKPKSKPKTKKTKPKAKEPAREPAKAVLRGSVVKPKPIPDTEYKPLTTPEVDPHDLFDQQQAEGISFLVQSSVTIVPIAPRPSITTTKPVDGEGTTRVPSAFSEFPKEDGGLGWSGDGAGVGVGADADAGEGNVGDGNDGDDGGGGEREGEGKGQTEEQDVVDDARWRGVLEKIACCKGNCLDGTATQRGMLIKVSESFGFAFEAPTIGINSSRRHLPAKRTHKGGHKGSNKGNNQGSKERNTKSNKGNNKRHTKENATNENKEEARSSEQANGTAHDPPDSRQQTAASNPRTSATGPSGTLGATTARIKGGGWATGRKGLPSSRNQASRKGGATERRGSVKGSRKASRKGKELKAGGGATMRAIAALQSSIGDNDTTGVYDTTVVCREVFCPLRFSIFLLNCFSSSS